MNSQYMFVVAAMAVMLIGATAFATDSAFADGKKKYGKNQAIGQTNACGNGDMPMNILCSNTGSQVQGDKNAVALDSFQQGADYSKKDWDHDNGDGGSGGSSGTANQDNSGGTNSANNSGGTNNVNSGSSGTANQDNSGGTNSGQNDGNAN
jgi:hypothetical protein